jgi:membrane-associated phospholipid phosphatase
VLGAATRVDLDVHLGFDEIRDLWLLHQFTKFAHLGDPGPAFALSLGVVLLAMLERGARCALVVAAVIVLANLTTVLLAHTVSIHRAPLPGSELWPSNHTTAVAAAGLCLPLIFPARGRRLAALLAFGMSAGITLMLIIRGTHLLTDLVAALLVAGFWAVVGAQVLEAHASS